MTELDTLVQGREALEERVDVVEQRLDDLTRILDSLLYELEEGTDPRKAAMLARDHLEAHELRPTGTT